MREWDRDQLVLASFERAETSGWSYPDARSASREFSSLYRLVNKTKKRTGRASRLNSSISEAALNPFIDALQDGVGFDGHSKCIVTAMDVMKSLDELGQLFV